MRSVAATTGGPAACAVPACLYHTPERGFFQGEGGGISSQFRCEGQGRALCAPLHPAVVGGFLAVPLRRSGWGLRAPTPCGSSFEKEEPENGDTLPLVKSLSLPVLFGGRAQSAVRRRLLAASLFVGCHTCALHPAAQKGRDLTSSATVAVRGAPWLCSGSLASRTWRVMVVGFALELQSPELGSFRLLAFLRAAEKAFPLPRSHRPPSGVVPRSAKGTRRRPKQAARWGQGAPHHKGRGNCCPATRANSPPIR